jgi:hypothetical protein
MDMIADGIASLTMNNQTAVYINDEKNAGEPTNLSVPIPAIPLIPKRHQPGITAGARENRTFSDVLLILHTTLDPKVFPTIEDRPRHQQYYFESENTEAMAQKINGNLKKILTVIKNAQAPFTRIDVHFAKGGDNCAASLENAAARKRKEFQAANESFLKIVKKLREMQEP